MTSIYVDGELLVVGYLEGVFPPARVATELPANLADVLPTIWVQRFGGGTSGRSLDAPTFDVDCFAADRLTANSFASQVRTALAAMAGYTAFQATVSDVSVSSFGWRPYANIGVRRTGMTCSITLHNH